MDLEAVKSRFFDSEGACGHLVLSRACETPECCFKRGVLQSSWPSFKLNVEALSTNLYYIPCVGFGS
jgi:hypothetical protein